jgi:PaaX-like protein
VDNYRLKIKVGDHEFEAEGPSDVVKEQFNAFKELIATMPSTSAANKPLASAQAQVDNSVTADASGLALDKITRTNGRFVSLTARPESVEDALLLTLLGQRMYRANDTVTGSELIDGLRQSGINVGRVDWRLEKMATQGLIIKIGSGRASRYRLTNQGMSKAQEIARTLISLVP